MSIDILTRLDAHADRSRVEAGLCDTLDDAWVEIHRLREQVRVEREAIQGFLDNPRRTSPLSRHKMASALAQLDATAPAEGASDE